MTAASQDFRDGAAMGARILAERIIAVKAMGVTATPAQIRDMAGEIAYTYGGAPISDSAAREAARVL